jgi:hypothetical protein
MRRRRKGEGEEEEEALQHTPPAHLHWQLDLSQQLQGPGSLPRHPFVQLAPRQQKVHGHAAAMHAALRRHAFPRFRASCFGATFSEFGPAAASSRRAVLRVRLKRPDRGEGARHHGQAVTL